MLVSQMEKNAEEIFVVIKDNFISAQFTRPWWPWLYTISGKSETQKINEEHFILNQCSNQISRELGSISVLEKE